MKFSKLIALILAVVMLLSLLAACNTEKPVGTQPKETQGTNKPEETKPAETTEPKEELSFPLAETMDFTVMAVLGNATYPLATNVAWQYLQELSNFNFITTEFAPSDAQEKMNLLMSSGEYTDIIFKSGKIDYEQYGMDGIIIPLEGMIRDYMPNLSAILDERDAWGAITAPDGHIYSLPSISHALPRSDGGMFWWINKSWLDKLGLEEPDTIEELYTVLKAFKEKDPNGNGIADEIPMAGWDSINAYNSLLAMFGEGLGYKDWWMVIDGQMEYLPTTQFFKENGLELFNKMYTEGILNPDMFTMDRDQFRAVCGGEQIVYGMLWDSTCSYFSDPNEIFNWITLKPFDTEMFSLSNGVGGGGLSITDKCKNPETFLAFFDIMYTEEGGRIARNGKENVSYYINEDGTYQQISEGFESNVYQATLMGTVGAPCLLPDLYYNWPAKEVSRWTNNQLYGKDFGVATKGTLVPKISLTVEENEEYSVLFTDINSYVTNYFAECTTGIISIEETWENFQATLKQMGVDRMIEIYRNAYDRAVAG